MKTVFCHGVWDILHPGHIAHLEEARAMGDCLIVGVTADEHVNKGVGRPIFSAEQRATQLEALQCVDQAVVIREPSCVGFLDRNGAGIDLYVKGCDYTYDMLLEEEKEVMERRGIEFTTTVSAKDSSTSYYRRLVSPYPRDTQVWLENFARRYSADDAVEAIDGLEEMKILIVGEAIEDVYTYVQTLAKSPREHYMSSRRLSSHVYKGGVTAAFNHLTTFCRRVSLRRQSATISKERFVDSSGCRQYPIP
jgi:cytidyltransferase-like protein